MNIRRIDLADALALQRLMLSNSGYTQRVEGRDPEPDAAREALTALPPDVGRDQKWDFGVWDGDLLVAFVDVIVGWPQPEMAHIGLLITDGEREGRGLGKLLHDAVLDKLIDSGSVEVMRLSIVDTNAAVAEPFWTKMGYHATGEAQPYVSGVVTSTARIWVRSLAMN